MSLLDRIANYFKEWDGIDETAPKMELSINDLRYIANMNVERCRLIKQLNEANLKTEKLLLDKTDEIRAKVIDEFAEKLKYELNGNIIPDNEKFIYARKQQEQICHQNMTLKRAIKYVDYIAEQLKGGAE